MNAYEANETMKLARDKNFASLKKALVEDINKFCNETIKDSAESCFDSIVYRISNIKVEPWDNVAVNKLVVEEFTSRGFLVTCFDLRYVISWGGEIKSC